MGPRQIAKWRIQPQTQRLHAVLSNLLLFADQTDRSHFLTVAVFVTSFNLTAGKDRLLAEAAILDCI
jgi:hypothetical protein